MELDANGEADVWIDPALSYKFSLTDEDDVPISTVDKVTAVQNASITSEKLATSVAGAGLSGGGGSALAVNVDNSTIEINSDTLRVKALGVGTSHLADGAVTQAKRAALGQQISSSSGSFNTSSTSYVDVTNLSVSITTTGRPVFVGLIPDGTADDGSESRIAIDTLVDGGSFACKLVRGSTDIASFSASLGAEAMSGVNESQLAVPVGSLFTIEAPAAGTYTYKAQTRVSSGGGGTVTVLRAKLIAYEL